MEDDIFKNHDISWDAAKIRVVGVGGGGCNAVNYMLAEKIEGVHFVCVNTDIKDLAKVQGATQVPIGKNLTRGLGAGGDPVRGREAALENKEDIYAQLEETDMLFVTAGLGGGTGTGAAPIVAEVGKELGILVVGVVTKPFDFEGDKRRELAEKGLEQLHGLVDSLIVIPNNRLLEKYGHGAKLSDAFGAVNNVLMNAVRGIAELITKPGLINVDFADVKTIMSEMGMAMMGTGSSNEEDAAIKAVEQAMASPLLENVSLQGAKGILVNVTGNGDIRLEDLRQVGERARECAAADAKIIIGTTIDESLDNIIRVTLVAAGIDAQGPQFKVHKPDNKEDAMDDKTVRAGTLDVPSFLKRQVD